MPFWTTFKEIHIHPGTNLFLMKGMTIKICMVNKRLETIYKAVEKNKKRKYILIKGWSMNILMKGKHC